MGAVLPLIGTDFAIGTERLGLVLGAFLAGAGIFQLPAGFAALRWGNRRVCLAALAVMGAFALASAFAPNWIVLAGLRFGVGAGAAFFFAPALGLVASYYPAGARGPVIGLYNAGFSVGAGIGILAGAVLGEALGWPWALGIGGVALLVAAAGASVFLPPTAPPPSGSSRAAIWAAAAPLLRSRTLWSLALALTGLWAASYILAQYTVQFAATAHPGWSLTLAASLPTLLILIEVVGGPYGGWVGERAKGSRRLLVVWGIPAGVVIFLVPYLPFAGLLLVFGFFGFAVSVVFADLYLVPSYLPGMQPETLALSLALINGVQILLGSGLAIAFGFVAVDAGFTVAWYCAAIAALVALPMLALAAIPRPAGGARVAAGREAAR